jgi:hypothetical protein
MSGLEVFELFRGFFKTVSSQPVAITEGHRFDSLHPLHEMGRLRRPYFRGAT